MTKHSDGKIKGQALWCHVVEPETFKGQSTNKLTVTLMPSVEDLKTIMEEARVVFEEFKEKNQKRMVGEPNFGSYREDDNGDVTIKFVTNAVITTKSGKTLEKVVPVFDGHGKPVSAKIKSTIGNGSEVVVAYQLFPYWNTSKNFGVSFRLDAMQLLKYIPYGAGADASTFGFADHEGTFDSTTVADEDAEGTEQTACDADVPFPDDEDF